MSIPYSPQLLNYFYSIYGRRKCKRYYIKENKKGNIENFVDIPGLPDNIHYDGDGHFWIASISVKSTTFIPKTSSSKKKKSKSLYS